MQYFDCILLGIKYIYATAVQQSICEVVFVLFLRHYYRYEPHHEKTNNLHMRKQRRRSAWR